MSGDELDRNVLNGLSRAKLKFRKWKKKNA